MVAPASCRQRGVTTLEMVLCMGILGLLASSVVVAESRDFRFARESHDRAAALRVCGARLEEYASSGAPEPGERFFPLPPVLAERFPGAVAMERVAEAGPGLVEVEVSVEWKAAGGEPRLARLRTLRSRPLPDPSPAEEGR